MRIVFATGTAVVAGSGGRETADETEFPESAGFLRSVKESARGIDIADAILSCVSRLGYSSNVEEIIGVREYP